MLDKLKNLIKKVEDNPNSSLFWKRLYKAAKASHKRLYLETDKGFYDILRVGPKLVWGKIPDTLDPSTRIFLRAPDNREFYFKPSEIGDYYFRNGFLIHIEDYPVGYRRNIDEDIRREQRQSSDPARELLNKMRTGEVDYNDVAVASYLGDAVSSQVIPKPDIPHIAKVSEDRMTDGEYLYALIKSSLPFTSEKTKLRFLGYLGCLLMTRCSYRINNWYPILADKVKEQLAFLESGINLDLKPSFLLYWADIITADISENPHDYFENESRKTILQLIDLLKEAYFNMGVTSILERVYYHLLRAELTSGGYPEIIEFRLSNSLYKALKKLVTGTIELKTRKQSYIDGEWVWEEVCEIWD